MEREATRVGRPREFDLDSALDAALTVFWRNGFEGASLTDLTAAMKINRPSLYAAFGSKEGLFRRAVERYVQRVEATLRACDAEPTAREYVECALRVTVDGATDCRHPAGCFLVQGALACSEAAESLRQEVARRRTGTHELLRTRFERADASGELPPGTDPQTLASFYSTFMHGISVQAVNGVSRAELHRAVDLALSAWPRSDKGKATRAKRAPTPAKKGKRAATAG